MSYGIFTFPQMVKNLPKKWFPSGVEPGMGLYNPKSGLAGAIGDFHRDQMIDRKYNVKNYVKNTTSSELLNLIGGVRNLMPKPQPAGSFSMPLNMNGNTAYGNSSPFNNLKGGFRTQAGQLYGMKLLQKRAEQLEDMADALEGIPPVVKAPTKMGESETEKIAVELALNSLQTASMTDEWEKLQPNDLRKLFSVLATHGTNFVFGDLMRYKELLRTIIANLEIWFRKHTYFFDKNYDRSDLSAADKYAMNKVGEDYYELYEDRLHIFDLIYKCYNIVEALIFSYKLQKKERTLYLKSATQEIVNTKRKDQENLDIKLQHKAKRYKEAPALEGSWAERRTGLRAGMPEDLDERKRYADAVGRLEAFHDTFGEGRWDMPLARAMGEYTSLSPEQRRRLGLTADDIVPVPGRVREGDNRGIAPGEAREDEEERERVAEADEDAGGEFADLPGLDDWDTFMAEGEGEGGEGEG